MADQLLVDIDPDGRVLVTAWGDGDSLPDSGLRFRLDWRLSDEALNDLRWYLEDYLAAPFGVYEERGPRIQQLLPKWGTELFGAIFGSGSARDVYTRMRAKPGTRLVLRSRSPVLLELPWELMRDPARPLPIALEMAGMSRSLLSADQCETQPVRGGRLRVLMVISRPAGSRDVSYQIIARPLLRRLEAVRGEVDLTVLRPPTLDALAATLIQARAEGSPFQVVHFDGHGMLNRTAEGGRAEGLLAFEKESGGPDVVPVSRVAQVLARASVPVVVLNACQSGAIGKDLETAIATRLLQEGTASVVAMAYTVYAVAAAEFMAAFYESLFAGDAVSAAVAAGRRRMYTHNQRPSPKGAIPLDDWLVPVHYYRSDISFPLLRTSRQASLSLDEHLDEIRVGSNKKDSSLDPAGQFIGRDALLYELEAATRRRRVIVLHGPGGTGKTELAKAFGRWWRDTGGVRDPRHIIFRSFEHGDTFRLDGAVNDIGLSLFGLEFVSQETAVQRAAVEKVLSEEKMLLIWDNFETVRSMPDPEGVVKPLDEDACREVTDFLNRLSANSKSTVIITSRTLETWLGDVKRITTRGLTPREADTYADDLLAPHPVAAARRGERAFGELMEWLAGHPLSMRLVLPRLETDEPAALLSALRGTTPLPGTLEFIAGPDISLAACIAYSYFHLSEATRRLLPAISLLQGIADVDFLAEFSEADGVPERFIGKTEEDWNSALGEAAGVGLLTDIGSGIYELHPALPAFLAASWREEESESYASERDAAVRALISTCGAFGSVLYETSGSDTAVTSAAVRAYHTLFTRILALALANQQWADAIGIVRALTIYWDSEGQAYEAAAWCGQIRLTTEDSGTAPPLENSAGALWLLAISEEGRWQLSRADLDGAKGTFLQIRSRVENAAPSPWLRKCLAFACGKLGEIAYRQGLLEEAENYAQEALAAQEELADQLGTIESQIVLGKIALERSQTDLAENWYRRALSIAEAIGDKNAAARVYFQLGRISESRGRYDDSETWYRKSLAVAEAGGHQEQYAADCSRLGAVAMERGRLEEAESWFLKTLVIREVLSDREGAANVYQQLGIIAQDRGRLDEAESWYLKSLAANRELGETRGMANGFMLLGLLAGARGQPRIALEWSIRCVTLFEEFPHPSTGATAAFIADLSAILGTDALETSWRNITGNPLPQEVGNYVRFMNDPVGHISRAAARRLEPEYGLQLSANVESALYAQGSSRKADTFFDPVALGSLIVSIASLGWTIYNSLRAREPRISSQAAKRELHVQLKQQVDETPNNERIIEVIVTEITRNTSSELEP